MPPDAQLFGIPLQAFTLLLGVLFVAALAQWMLARLRAARAAEQQAALLAEQAELLDLAHDAILVWELKSGAIRFWNRGAEVLYGWSATEVLGRTPQAILNTGFPFQLADINAELERSGRWEGELSHQCRDGSVVIVSSRWALKRNPGGQPTAVLGINSDITARKATEAALAHQALHDALTDLPNRTLFSERLERALAANPDGVAVLFMDLDNFKLVNDSLGHDSGDALLQEVAQRIQGCLRAGDIAARLGGDEFTVLLQGLEQAEDVERVVERITSALHSPVVLREREVHVSASIGVALSRADEMRADALLRNADMAMYQAKSAGPGRHAVFGENCSELPRMALDNAA